MGEESPEDSFASLLDAHADFVDKLTELEATLDEMMALRDASDANREVLDEAIRFFNDELLPHMQLEDDVVLPPLEAKIGRFGTLVNVVAYEHDEIRREVEKFREARVELERSDDPWPGIQELNRHGIFTIQFLWDHFRKEKVSLFPTAREELSRPDLEIIRKRLAH